MRHRWMDLVRGTAILFLLLSHASTIPGITAAIATPEAVHLLNAFLSPFRMPVLMVLSGALLARSLGRPLGTYIWGKARVLVWSYLVWAIVIFAVLGRLSELLRPWEWVQTLYLWYLAFLFVYYLIALLVPRIGAMPVLLTAVGMTAVAGAAQLAGLLCLPLPGHGPARAGRESQRDRAGRNGHRGRRVLAGAHRRRRPRAPTAAGFPGGSAVRAPAVGDSSPLILAI